MSRIILDLGNMIAFINYASVIDCPEKEKDRLQYLDSLTPGYITKEAEKEREALAAKEYPYKAQVTKIEFQNHPVSARYGFELTAAQLDKINDAVSALKPDTNVKVSIGEYLYT